MMICICPPSLEAVGDRDERENINSNECICITSSNNVHIDTHYIPYN